MTVVRAWVRYSVYRVLMFAVPLTILLLLLRQSEWWLAALLSAAIGLCLSYIFLRKPRERIANDLYQARHRNKEPVHPDAESEDAALDRAALNDSAPHNSAPHNTAPHNTAPHNSEREGETEQQTVGEGTEAGELEGNNKLP